MTIEAENIEKLAATIGEEIYIDVAKWHLYLANAHLHKPLAERLYPMVEGGNADRVEEGEVIAILRDFKVAVGGGRKELPLIDLLPPNAAEDITKILIRVSRDF
ncbi:hypothetical protein Pse7367_2973 [Thalassoporum mexicanum PCC 7367]|uniref:DUF3181 family protein n=1 Tax=Thalassoporum mexicanum TaxID=3457544 RepID=UPI00029FF0DC|nr:DUF3181 family protein [Pseudanabaena sp. PCC 7367]AFY71224.1 hypothetical protein Pse7367_2973 [Pseudanabaena sp. PCC 7367]